MKKKSAQSQTNTKTNNKTSKSTISFVGIIGIFISMLLALVTFLMPISGPDNNAPVVVFVGDYSNFPTKSMTNVIHASGFEIDVQGANVNLDDEKYIIVGVGDNSFNFVTEYRDNKNVLGFVLLCPTFPDGSHVSGMNSQIPSQDIAIFAGKDEVENVASIGDARLIYERLSGDDTVFGTPIKRGGLFASKCYVNNNQNRWLSLSAFEITSGEIMLFNPLFQNELAGYLSTSYGNNRDTSYSRINMWYMLLFASVLLALVSFCIYLAGLHITSTKKNISGKVIVLLVLISIILVAAITFGSFIPRLSNSVLEIVPFISIIVFAVGMIISGASMVIGKEDNGPKTVVRGIGSREVLLRDLFLSGAPLILIGELLIALGDIASDNIGIIMAMAVLDIVACSVVSIYGGKYKLITMLLAMLLSFIVIDVGVVAGNNDLMYYAMIAFVSSLAAFITSWPISRHGSNPVLTGVTHGLTVFMVIATLL